MHVKFEIVESAALFKNDGARHHIPQNILINAFDVKSALEKAKIDCESQVCFLPQKCVHTVLLTVDASLPQALVNKVLKYPVSDALYMGGSKFFGAPLLQSTITPFPTATNTNHNGFDITNSIQVALNVAASIVTALDFNKGIETERRLLQARGFEIAIHTKEANGKCITLSRADAEAIVHHYVGDTDQTTLIIKSEKDKEGVITIGAVLSGFSSKKFVIGSEIRIPIVRDGGMSPYMKVVKVTIKNCQYATHQRRYHRTSSSY